LKPLHGGRCQQISGSRAPFSCPPRRHPPLATPPRYFTQEATSAVFVVSLRVCVFVFPVCVCSRREHVGRRVRSLAAPLRRVLIYRMGGRVYIKGAQTFFEASTRGKMSTDFAAPAARLFSCPPRRHSPLPHWPRSATILHSRSHLNGVRCAPRVAKTMLTCSHRHHTGGCRTLFLGPPHCQGKRRRHLASISPSASSSYPPQCRHPRPCRK